MSLRKPGLLLFCIGISGYLFPQQLAWVSKVGARSFPKSPKIFQANQYGAVGDGSTVNSAFIQKAIDACAAAGGGIVTFRPGTYVTGSLFVKSNVELRIDKEVLLLGSQDFADYPEIDTRIAGIEMKWPAALLNFIDVTNAAVTGSGIVNARGKFCWDKYWTMRKDYDAKGLRWIVDYDAKRVRTVLVQNASDITLKNLTFKNAGFWTVQLLYSHHLTVDGLVIKNNEDGHGPSTDGIDIDSSSWTLIQNCDIDCNDDNFCLKAGRDWDGLRVNRPTEYVVIRKCLARRGGGLITLGSETSGGIRHVLATELVARNTDNGLRIKSAVTRGGLIEDIYFRNSQLDSVRNVFQYNLNWNPAYSYSQLPAGYDYHTIPPHWKAMLQKVTPAEKGIPHAKDVYVDNIRATHASTIFGANGLAQSYLSNFVYSNSRFSGNVLGQLEYTSGWKFQNVSISVEKAAAAAKPVSKEVSERLQ
ncbi:glycoside hydrolase family 28 protein [Sediminibacterium soli]|uniref:glycoside hydrolase family 28 protein n=1 Tax=Sediminibacterium soli TaxID=2698829 RepID=UPI001379C3A3|nr:glycoside hydrolase family 28 protein [Sediminibacterium soli]NCI46851.1 glycoside hydrolase family 28 protein [Sediminibacterium soli]